MVHKLSVHPITQPVRQKRQTFTHERNQALAKEVDKFLQAQFIREVHYPDWLVMWS